MPALGVGGGKQSGGGVKRWVGVTLGRKYERGSKLPFGGRMMVECWGGVTEGESNV